MENKIKFYKNTKTNYTMICENYTPSGDDILEIVDDDEIDSIIEQLDDDYKTMLKQRLLHGTYQPVELENIELTEDSSN